MSQTIHMIYNLGKLFSFVLILCLITVSASRAAPESDLWDYWTAHNQNSTEVIRHTEWDTFQLKFVYAGEDGINRVAYGSVPPTERKILDRYIQNLASVTVTGLNRPEQMAYWINLYNALTVQVILDAYPVSSIRDIDISPGFFSDGPWGKKLIEIEGKTVSLDDIEHRILRPIWQDPRIHYVINCAALGCPNLTGHAFTPENTDEILDQGARAYINHPRGVDVRNGNLVVSSIYKWFQEDFGGTEAGVIQHLIPYAETDLAREISKAKSIDDYEYDWALNDTHPTVAEKIKKRKGGGS